MKLILSLLCLSALPVLAQEFDEDRPSTTVTLTTEQKDEMATLATLTLTTEQWAQLRKKSPGTPRRLPMFFEGHQFNCIDEKRVTIYHEPLEAKAIASRISGAKHMAFLVDYRGQFHLDGLLIPYAMVLEILGKGAPESETRIKGARAVVYIALPPGMEETDERVAARIKEVRETAKTANWQILMGRVDP